MATVGEIVVTVLAAPLSAAGEAWAAASAAERERATAYQRSADRDRSVLSADLLRRLARQLGAAGVTRVCRVCGRVGHGRPVAVDAAGHALAEVFLSSSHAGGWVVAAAAGVAIGVDCEPLANTLDDATAAIALTPAERAAADAAADPARARLATWVKKEALLKATGWGLALEPATVQVTPTVTLPDPLADSVTDIQFLDLPLDPAHLAVLAALTPQPVTLGTVPFVTLSRSVILSAAKDLSRHRDPSRSLS
ncbi:MAG: 4'-phosphopantetheinyl transferase superfamily protein [Propionibacteriaceae bacterium]|jgi:4'-phosphopantetheinyl transferase|nr:4'-phosphopantetheinyl transferase superfamily protein [Propionibacteriaceae bacterium]